MAQVKGDHGPARHLRLKSGRYNVHCTTKHSTYIHMHRALHNAQIAGGKIARYMVL
jgi:hypothetical protein